MSGIAWDTTELVQTLKDRGLIPSDQSTFDTAAFLRACTQELWGEVLVDILRARKKHLVFTEDQLVTANQDHYRIPYRAVGGALASLHLVNSDSSLTELVLLEPEDVVRRSFLKTYQSGSPRYFYIENQEVVLFPMPSTTTGTLRLKYHIRPNKLVPVTEAAKISAITALGGGAQRYFVSTADTVPALWTNLLKYDFIAGRPGFQHFNIDQQPTAVTTGLNGFLDFAAGAIPAAPKTPAVGDYICLAEESAVPQIPAELHALLAIFGLTAVLKSIGDYEAAKGELEEAARKEAKALSLIIPRVGAKPRRTVNRFWLR